MPVFFEAGKNFLLINTDEQMTHFEMNRFLHTFKPAVPKRYLMFIAAVVWFFAGGMLLSRGLSFMAIFPRYFFLRLTLSIAAGLIFYVIMFSRIAAKHILRILHIEYERPCLFSFFNWKSYVMMGSMATMGVLLRTFHLVPLEYLSSFYVVMGTPLLLSAFRFLSVGFQQSDGHT